MLFCGVGLWKVLIESALDLLTVGKIPLSLLQGLHKAGGLADKNGLQGTRGKS